DGLSMRFVRWPRSWAQLDMTTRARVRMDSGYASKCLRDAVHLLLSVGGASTFARTNPV
ncbi:MAG: hypothetical protein QOC67_616, partial [Pseudonocardiales bacterium]|nr:hypothetical protein [Pseudonocardiales bacterium]